MRNKQKQVERVTSINTNEIKYYRNMRRDRMSSNDNDDRYSNGELLVAANILTELAAKRASQHNMSELMDTYEEVRAGTYDYRHDDWNESGYTSKIPNAPPLNWPLSAKEWPAQQNQVELLNKAATLIVSERERLERVRNVMYRGGRSLLDDEYRELQTARQDIAKKQRNNQWKRSVKDVEIAVDVAPTPAYDATLNGASIDISNIRAVTVTAEPCIAGGPDECYCDNCLEDDQQAQSQF